MTKSLLWLRPARRPFLLLTPACIILGMASVQWHDGHVNWLDALTGGYSIIAAVASLMAIGIWMS